MDEQIETTSQAILRHENVLNEHSKMFEAQAEQIKSLQDNNIKLENIVMSENRETRATITETNKQVMELMGSIVNYKSGETQADQSKTIARWEAIAKITGILAGSGGILYWIFGGK